MMFYRVEGFITDEKWAERNNDRRVMRENVRRIARRSVEFNGKHQRKAFFYVADASEDTITVGVICREPSILENQIPSFLNGIALELRDICVEEITFNFAYSMLQSASRNDYIRDYDDILELFELDKLVGRYARGTDFSEYMIEEVRKTEAFRTAEHFLASDTLIPELLRIYEGRHSGKATGHPVHYMIQTDEQNTRKGMYQLLLQALYTNNRIESKRYCLLDFKPGENFSRTVLDCLYKSCTGGAIVIGYHAYDDSEDDHATCGRETIESLCMVMKKYRNQVLTIFCFPRECTKSKDIFYEHLGTVSFVELIEEYAFGERAKVFLKMLAQESKIRVDKRLFSMLEVDKGYLASELHDLFDEWYNHKLKTGIYPQYRDITNAKHEVIKATPKGSAYDELMGMTGLTEAKKVINQALAYDKAQKLFFDKGMKADHPTMHMMFTGNPGTAKTTVARLFARILKDNNLLSKGKLIEVGRGELVGKYVGWTAPSIQKKFREAQGCVLFIDEAYSLVDDRDGSYGDEAINTIVQEMENHRDDMVVIFAGYPDKMDVFMKKNPGLRSRIAYHVPFADYNTEELCDIAKQIAKQKGMVLTEDACVKLSQIFNAARFECDFGNGRYVRNVIEKARMVQAARLLTMDFDLVGRNDVITLCADDIEAPAISVNPMKRQIGFCMSI